MQKTMIAIGFFSFGIVFHYLYVGNQTGNEVRPLAVEKKPASIEDDNIELSRNPTLPNLRASTKIRQNPIAKKASNLCEQEKQEISALKNQLYLYTDLEEIEGAADLEETEYLEFVSSVTDKKIERYFERRERNKDYGAFDLVISSPEYKELYKELLLKIYSPKELMMDQRYQKSAYIKSIIDKTREFQQALSDDERYNKLIMAAYSSRRPVQSK